MFMHPDHHDFIMKLFKAVAIVWICALAYKFGQSVYHELRN